MTEFVNKNNVQPEIRLESLQYDAGDRRILDGVNLDVLPGEIFAVMGRSGSGKTTILRLIMGLVRANAGHIWVGDEEVTWLSERELLQVRKKMGMVFQNAALFDSLTIAENVGFGLREHGADEDEIRPLVKEKLSLVGLENVEDLLPAELSGGMRKRVGVARALIMEPSIILYDEPTAGLDPPTAESLNELILDLRDRLGVTTVIVSHDIYSLAQVTDRAAMLESGRICAVGKLKELAKSEDPDVRSFFVSWKGETQT